MIWYKKKDNNLKNKKELLKVFKILMHLTTKNNQVT